MLYRLLPQPEKSFITKFPEFHPSILSLLWQRNIKTESAINDFLNPQYAQKEFDPFQFKEMKAVVKRLLKAAEAHERVLVYGDYDTDGVCSAILLVETLERLYQIKSERKNRDDADNQELIQVYLPHREEEGYGLNPTAVKYIIEQKISLLITCDCGTTNITELKALHKAGIEVIIIDHHVVPGARPPVVGFINPKFKKDNYPFRELAAAGVVFKVIQGLRQYQISRDEPQLISEGFEKWSLDLVAMATITDVMPLLQENRSLVKWGLMVLNKTKRSGLKALIDAAGIERTLTAVDVSFMLGPRINAAGRLDHANVAYDLLRQTDKSIALAEADKLNKTNATRQKLTERIVASAKKQVAKQIKQNDFVLVAYCLKINCWPTGLIGLVAGRLAKEFNRPACVIGYSNHGLAGSGRSIENFDIFKAVSTAEKIFEKSGGHPQACGFTFIKKTPKQKLIKEFKSKVEIYAKQKITPQDLLPRLPITQIITLPELSLALVRLIAQLQPFGEGNREPIFLTKNAKVESVKLMGAASDHVKMVISQGSSFREAVFFRFPPEIKNFKPGDHANLIYTLELNVWRGEERVQLIVREMEKIEP